MNRFFPAGLFFTLYITALCFKPIPAQAPLRVDAGYEDSVRIVILWNNPDGHCGWMPAVGAQTRDSLLKSISGGRLGDSLWTRVTPDITPNIKALPTLTTTWENIKALWPGKLPHVIVHVNAGWGSPDLNGDATTGNLAGVYADATQNYVGVVEVGDDASWMAINVFGFNLTDNMPQPVGGGTQYTLATDTMFVGMYPQRDTLVDPARFPYLNGIVKNASNLANARVTNPAYRNMLFFKPYDPNGRADTLRCEADADRYTVQPEFRNKLLYLGYQDVSVNGVRQVVPPDYSELDVIVAFQDTIRNGGNIAVRRAVALSMEPQFLKNCNSAVDQLVYDAIMFASLAWQLRPVNKLALKVTDSCFLAGDTVTVTATLFRDNIPDTSSIRDSVTWMLDPATSRPDDWISGNVSANKGQKVKVSGIVAYRTIDVIGQYIDPQTSRPVMDTARLCILPAAQYRIVVVGMNDTVCTNENKNTPRPLDRVTMDSAVNHDTVFAVTYDRYNNWSGKAVNAVWASSNQAVVIAGAVQNKKFAGAIDRMTENADSAYVHAGQPGVLPDSILIILSNATGIATTVIAIRLVDGNGNPVTSVTMAADEQQFLRIQVRWSNDTLTWVDGTGRWTFNPAGTIVWAVDPPAGNQAGTFTLDPVTPGQTRLTVAAGTKSLTIPITVNPVDTDQPQLTEGYYVDANADGMVDGIYLRFDKEVPVDSVSVSLSWPGARTPQIGPLSGASLNYGANRATVRVTIPEASQRANGIRTSGTMSATVRFTGLPDGNRTADLIDSAAPVIDSAIYRIGDRPGNDTLVVRFSERVRLGAAASPFTFIRDGAAGYSPSMEFHSLQDNHAVFIVRGGEGVMMPEKGDSIFINPVSAVGDSLMWQNNAANRRVILTLEPGSLVTIVPIGSPKKNPMDISGIKGRFGIRENSGKIIAIGTKQPLDTLMADGEPVLDKKDGKPAFGTAMVYDAVGNLVKDELLIKKADVDRVYYVFWNGTNRNDRRVVEGAYLIGIRYAIDDVQGAKTRKLILRRH